MNNSNNSNKNIIISILLIAVICLAGFIFYEQMNKPEEKKESNVVEKDDKPIKKEETIELSVNDAIVKELYGYVGKDYIFTSSNKNNAQDFNDMEKEILALQLLTSNDFINTNTKKTYYDNGYSEEGNLYTLPKSKMDNAMKKIFGDSVTYTPTTVEDCEFGTIIKFGTSTSSLAFNSATNNFEVILNVGGCGGTSNELSVKKLMTAKQTGDEIVLEEKFVFASNITENGKNYIQIFSDLNKSNLIGSVEFDFTNGNINNMSFDQYLTKGLTVTYSFKKNNNNGNYNFDNSKIN